VARRTGFGVAFLPTLDHLGIAGDAATRAAVGRVVGRLFNAEHLPAPGDVRVRVFLMPEPDREVLCYSRRVLGYALWLVYQFDDAEVVALAVTDRPPRPAD